MTTPSAPLASYSRAFRLNCPSHKVPRVEALLQAEGFTFDTLPFYPLGRCLTDGPTALGNALAHLFGYIYIQDRSSMLPPLLLDPPKGAVVLDICASPGSKTSLLARLVGPKGLVVANEPNPSRLATLRSTLRTQNLVGVVTTCYPGQDLPLDEGNWPFILLDAPCSGWGTVNKNPQVMKLWTQDKLVPLVRLQKKLLAKAVRLLAPGGVLVYSTCTTNPQENEEQIRWAVDTLGLELNHLDPLNGFTAHRHGSPELAHCLLVDGDTSRAQDFFVARLTKPGNPGQSIVSQDSAKGSNPLSLDLLTQEQPLREQTLQEGGCYLFNNRVFFLHHKALQLLPPSMRWQGMPLGTLRKNRFRIDPVLYCLMPEYEVGGGLNVTDVSVLHNLLSGQSLPTSGTSRGLYWQGLPLGWLTRKGKRCLWSGR
ncbi:MAG: RNA methyltransferase [Deltaproteobacteria bacterium]|nr:MAG: RNA methyltransferase [Deltaproteobacteria bacterium]